GPVAAILAGSGSRREIKRCRPGEGVPGPVELGQGDAIGALGLRRPCPGRRSKARMRGLPTPPKLQTGTVAAARLRRPGGSCEVTRRFPPVVFSVPGTKPRGACYQGV